MKIIPNVTFCRLLLFCLLRVEENISNNQGSRVMLRVPD